MTTLRMTKTTMLLSVAVTTERVVRVRRKARRSSSTADGVHPAFGIPVSFVRTSEL
jgi:hypothetical protein